jgi:nascent polypeptide-associated complex subunit alpha
MFPNLDPRKMQAVMRQMGINQEEVPASKVIIEKSDGGKVVIKNPSVVKIKMQNQESFQISGDISESEGEESGFSEKDIEVVMQKTSCSRKEAEAALEETGDLAEAILKLS